MRENILIFLKGMGMGGADVVPGVSGGTIALIAGIYERLLNAIRSVDLEAVRLLFQFKLREFWQKIDGAFLLPLVLGIATSLITLARVIKFFMEEHPIPLWSFFFGLILVSAIWVLKEVKQWHWGILISFVVGTIVAYLITSLSPAETPESLWFIFISGAIAICAMILPGISGSFLLLILGKYEFILESLNSRDLVTLGVFALGCLTGLLSFSRIIAWLLRHYHNITIALLAGFMIGSLNKVWPWKSVESFRLNSHGEQVPFLTKNVWPVTFSEITGEESQLILAILFFALGILLVVGLERLAGRRISD
jgi:putative membrane protein